MALKRHEDHGYNTRKKENFRLPRTFRKWGQERTEYHAVRDFNYLSADTKQLTSLNIFKRNILNFQLGSNVM